MRKIIQEVLFLKKGEQRALLLTAVLLLASLLLRVSVLRKPSQKDPPDKEFLVMVENLRKDLDRLQTQGQPLSIQAASHPLVPQVFDPNRISRAGLEAMGFPKRALSNLIRYREAGGHFRKPEDLLKIYGMDSTSYQILLDFIVIKGEPDPHKSSHVRQASPPSNGPDSLLKIPLPEPSKSIEINNADSLELMSIRGIGPVYSSRIIRYRDLLGGFYSLEQLWEIYGMDTLKFEFLSASVCIDTSLIRRREINEVSFHSLVRHPYFSRKEVSDLIHYRNFAGEIKSLDELKANQVIDSTAYEKMKHYLACRINEF